jgi:hypothetical protein
VEGQLPSGPVEELYRGSSLEKASARAPARKTKVPEHSATGAIAPEVVNFQLG